MAAASVGIISPIEGINSSNREFTETKEEIQKLLDEDPSLYERGGTNYLEIYGIGIVRHVAQLYEAGYCILISLLLFMIWYKKRNDLPEGFSFGLFMTLLWMLRFTDEFFKMNQEAFEDNMVLNMGQWLSIPMALIGIAVMIWSFQSKNYPHQQGT